MRKEASGKASRIAKERTCPCLRSADPGLEVVHPDAAGIDVGNEVHYVAVRPDRDPEPVRGSMFHSGSLPYGGVAAQLRSEDDRHAINGSLLDSPL